MTRITRMKKIQKSAMKRMKKKIITKTPLIKNDNNKNCVFLILSDI